MIPSQNVPERTTSQIFLSTRESLNYLIEVGLVERNSTCNKCELYQILNLIRLMLMADIIDVLIGHVEAGCCYLRIRK